MSADCPAEATNLEERRGYRTVGPSWEGCLEEESSVVGQEGGREGKGLWEEEE